MDAEIDSDDVESADSGGVEAGIGVSVETGVCSDSDEGNADDADDDSVDDGSADCVPSEEAPVLTSVTPESALAPTDASLPASPPVSPSSAYAIPAGMHSWNVRTIIRQQHMILSAIFSFFFIFILYVLIKIDKKSMIRIPVFRQTLGEWRTPFRKGLSENRITRFLFPFDNSPPQRIARVEFYICRFFDLPYLMLSEASSSLCEL
jgi:hypothetical protein